jgi:20S proteasome alpha/beta subunit
MYLLRRKALKMYFKSIYFTVLLLIFYNGYCQVRGTIIVAAICSDGIVIAADSRAILGTPNDPIAYFDNYQKIYKLEGYQIAVGGLYIFGDESIENIIAELNLQNPIKKDIKTTIDSLINYLSINFGNKINFETNQYIGGTYNNGIPEIISCSKILVPMIYDGKGVITNDPRMSPFIRYNAKMTSRQFAERIPLAIQSFVHAYNLTNKIGGPISIVQITPDNSFHYLQNDFTLSQFKNFSAFMKDVKEDRIHLNYVGKYMKEDVLVFFRDYCNKWGIPE